MTARPVAAYTERHGDEDLLIADRQMFSSRLQFQTHVPQELS